MGSGLPRFPQGFSCPVVLTNQPTEPSAFRLPGSHRLWPRVPAMFCYPDGFSLSRGSCAHSQLVVQPQHDRGRKAIRSSWFGLLPVRSPLLGESCLLLALLRCFSSGGALLRVYRFNTGYHPLPGDGLPHSEIAGSMLGYSSPTLFAVAHVLLRHSTPRHPPHAFLPSSSRPPSSEESDATRQSLPHAIRGQPAYTAIPRLSLGR